MREQEAEEEEEEKKEEEEREEEEVAEEETGVWRAFVIRDVLLARHSPLCSFAAISSLFLFVFFLLLLLSRLLLSFSSVFYAGARNAFN